MNTQDHFRPRSVCLSHNYMSLYFQQEYFPVGCVLPAEVAVCWGVSASVHVGIHPLTPVWAWSPPGCGPGEPPPGLGLETPPDPSTSPTGCGPGDPPGQTLQLPPPLAGVGLETPQPDPSTSPLGVGLETPPPRGQTDTSKNIAFANFVCGR